MADERGDNVVKIINKLLGHFIEGYCYICGSTNMLDHHWGETCLECKTDYTYIVL